MGTEKVIDAHHHLWDPARADYPWMADDSLAPIRRAFTVDDLRPLLETNSVDRTIVVQARSDIAETAELLTLPAPIAGVVGWIDLTADDAADVLGSLLGGQLVGVRHQVHDEPDADWLLRDDVRRGLRAVQGAGLVYELLVREPQLPAALATARDLPDLQFVIDHLAKPPIKAGEIDSWSAAMAPFGALDNVACKVSGMVTEASWDSWSTKALQPYVDAVLDWFGPDRLLFGSDWPVCLLAGSYAEVIEAARETLGHLSASERAAVFGGTAVRVYQLDPA